MGSEYRLGGNVTRMDDKLIRTQGKVIPCVALVWTGCVCYGAANVNLRGPFLSPSPHLDSLRTAVILTNGLASCSELESEEWPPGSSVGILLFIYFWRVGRNRFCLHDR